MLPVDHVLEGRYRIIERVGRGGMGAVYRAADLRLRTDVAVKEMSDAAIVDPRERQQARDLFEQEAQMLARLDHANLPRVTDHFGISDKRYIVMTFVDGPTLAQLLKNRGGPLDQDQVLSWALDLCDVLAYLHGRSPCIIFRDLKPSNIMVDGQGALKLIDFGIARNFKPGKPGDTQVIGTHGYAPPEQYGKGQTDTRSDIFSLGATLHCLLTARDPADEPFRFPPVTSLNAGVAPALAQVIARAVEFEPSARWQSAREMRGALQAIRTGAPSSWPVASNPRPSPSYNAPAPPSAAAGRPFTGGSGVKGPPPPQGLVDGWRGTDPPPGPSPVAPASNAPQATTTGPPQTTNRGCVLATVLILVALGVVAAAMTFG